MSKKIPDLDSNEFLSKSRRAYQDLRCHNLKIASS
jgi:hypothetical protein